MSAIGEFALETLRSLSPVSAGRKNHPAGLYRDNHMMFLNGHSVKTLDKWRPGDQVEISNPVPYARKIEAGDMKMSVPAGVYERAARIIDGEYGQFVKVSFTYMPVRFGDVQSWAAFSKAQKSGHKTISGKAKQDWLVRQPAIILKT